MADYSRYISEASAKYGVPEKILAGLIQAESSGNPRAVSPKGAQGLTQLMPGTAREVGVTDPFDPAQSIMGGAQYLAQQYKRFGSWPMALAAYNAGPARATQAATWPQVQGYINKVMGMPDLKTTAQSIINDPQRGVLLSQAIEAGKKATQTRDEAKTAVSKNQAAMQDVIGQIRQDRQTAPPAPGLRDIPAAPKPKPARNPLQVFGEVVPMMAIFGSAFTRGGAMSAMKTATAAMKAVKDRDAEEAKAAHDQWMDQLRQLQAQNQIEIERYKAVVDNRKLTMSERLAELQVLAAANKDTMLLAQLDAGNFDNALKLINTKDAMDERLVDILDTVERADEARQRLSMEQERYADEIEIGGIKSKLKNGETLTPGEWNRLGAEATSMDERLVFLGAKQTAVGLNAEEKKELEDLTQLRERSGLSGLLGWQPAGKPDGAGGTDEKVAKTPGAEAAAPAKPAAPAAAAPRGGVNRASAGVPQARGPHMFRIATADEREQMRQIKASRPDMYEAAKNELRAAGVDVSEFE